MYTFIWFELYHAFKEFYKIASKVSSRKSATTFVDLPDWLDPHEHTYNLNQIWSVPFKTSHEYKVYSLFRIGCFDNTKKKH